MKSVKKGLKILLYSIVAIVAILLLLIGITQTSFFKDRLRTIVVSNLSTQLNGSLYLGTIRGNFLNGFSVDSIAVLRGSEIVFSARRLVIEYDPLPFLQQKLNIKHLVIDQPRANFVRSREGSWNFIQLLKAADTSTPGSFEWTITLEDVQLRQGTVSLYDSAALAEPDHSPVTDSSLEYHNFIAHDLAFAFSGRISRNALSARVRHLSFQLARPNIQLNELTGDFVADTTGVSGANIHIRTSRSTLDLHASMRGLNIFEGVELRAMQYDTTRLHLTSNNLDLDELGMFISATDFLHGTAILVCDLEGQFGDLAVKYLGIQTRQSNLNLTGSIHNLHLPEDLYLTMQITNSKIDGPDLSLAMPAFDLPRFVHLGKVSLSGEFQGRPLHFRTKTRLSGRFGEADVDGSLNLTADPPEYSCTFSTKDLNLRDIIEEDKLKTSLSALGTLQGKGFTLDTLSAKLFLNIDSSKFQDVILNVGQLNVEASPHHLEVTSSFNALDMNATINGHSEFLETDHPTFSGDVILSSFDLSKILNEPEYESDLTLHTTFDGLGKSIDEMNGKISLALQPSTFQGRRISPFQLELALDQNDPSKKHLSLQSSLADVEIAGKFDLDVAVAAIANLSSNLVSTIEQHALPPDSSATEPSPAAFNIAPHSAAQRAMEFNYAFKIYDLEPLSSFLGGSQFNAHGTINGSISGSDESVTFTADAEIEEFFSGTVGNGIFLNDSKVSVSATNLSPIRTLESLTAQANFSVGHGLLNSRTLSDARGTIGYGQLNGKFTFAGMIDSMYTVSFGGQSSIQPHTYVFDLDSLKLGSSDYEWTNDQDIQTRLDYDGFRIMHAVLVRNEESLSFTGTLKHTGEFGITGALRRYDLRGLNFWLRNQELAQRGQGIEGTLDADVRLFGTTESPSIALSAVAQDVSVKRTKLGNAVAKVNYNDRLAIVDLTVKGSQADSTPTLTVSGRIPIDLSFGSVEHRFPDVEQHLSVVSNGFDLSVLDPVIPDLNDIRGKLQSNVTIAGTPRGPQYSGTIRLADVHCIFGPNNIPYVLDGELVPSGNMISLKDFTVRNPQSEQWKSDARFTGSLSIKDFRIDSFDITAYGQLLLMTNATRKTMPSFYGLLFTEIDPQGLNLRGTPEKPYLSGNLSILNADLEYPPTAGSERTKGQILNYVLIDDTSKSTADTLTFSSRFYQSSDTVASRSDRFSPRLTKPSFVERLRYNLVIDTKGTTAIKMIFTPSTNEELYAELEGKVNAINDQGTATIYGDITVLPRSYYNFFKRFDATGSLRFVGPWDNPVLDIDAAYEGYSQYVAEKSSIQSAPEEEQKSGQQKVIVKLKITGTRYEPKLAMNMQIQRDANREPEEYASVYKGGDVQSDAISFILTGKFRDELSSRERENIATNFGSAGVSGLTSNLLSSIFTDFLRKEFPFIRSAEVSYGGGSLQESANLRLSGEAFNGYFRFGGKILNDINNANVSYQLSLGRMLSVPSIRNLFIELERKVEGSDLTEDKKLTNNARLYYRISF